MLKEKLNGMMIMLVGIMLVFASISCSKQSKSGNNDGVAQAVEGAIPVQFQQGAQNNADSAKEMEKLYADMEAGKITEEEFQRRMIEFTNKMMGDFGFADIIEQVGQKDEQRRQKELQQEALEKSQRIEQGLEGDTAGWPPASAFTKWDMSNISQPAGTATRYSDWGQTLNIYISKANTNTLKDLKQKVEIALGKKVEEDSNSFYVRHFIDRKGSDGSTYGYILDINATLEYNVIVFSFFFSN